jgi:predicted Fe-Mo cluster-binding NifX family protein
MKIAASTTQGGLDDTVTEHFGRAESFTIVEVDGDEIKGVEVVKNTGAMQPSGAGIAASQLIVNKDADVLLTGNVGPKAFTVLQAAGVRIYRASGLKVSEAVEKCLRGELEEIISSGLPKKGLGRFR